MNRGMIVRSWCWCLLFVFAFPRVSFAEDEKQPVQIDWVEGPAKAKIGDLAEINVPKGYRFTGKKGTQSLLEATQNPVSGSELGFLAKDEADWFIIFDFDEVGYVKDDEKDSLDGSAILSSIKEGNEHANEERKDNGWVTLEIVGWEVPPKYDAVSHNLEWAVRAKDGNGQNVVNYNTRLLGRKGVMEASLVINPDALNATLPEFKTLLGGYAYTADESYASYRQGDKIAEYGLTALVTGGAVAVAAKSGLFKYLWKLIVVAGAAIAAFFRKLTGKKSAE